MFVVSNQTSRNVRKIIGCTPTVKSISACPNHKLSQKLESYPHIITDLFQLRYITFKAYIQLRFFYYVKKNTYSIGWINMHHNITLIL